MIEKNKSDTGSSGQNGSSGGASSPRNRMLFAAGTDMGRQWWSAEPKNDWGAQGQNFCVWNICSVVFGKGLCRRIVGEASLNSLTVQDEHKFALVLYKASARAVDRAPQKPADESVQHSSVPSSRTKRLVSRVRTNHRQNHAQENPLSESPAFVQMKKMDFLNKTSHFYHPREKGQVLLDPSAQVPEDRMHDGKKKGLIHCEYKVTAATETFYLLVFNVYKGRAVITLERVEENAVQRNLEMYLFSSCAPCKYASRLHLAKAFLLCGHDVSNNSLHVYKTPHWWLGDVNLRLFANLGQIGPKLPFSDIVVVEPNAVYDAPCKPQSDAYFIASFPIWTLGMFSFQENLMKLSVNHLDKINGKFKGLVDFEKHVKELSGQSNLRGKEEERVVVESKDGKVQAVEHFQGDSSGPIETGEAPLNACTLKNDIVYTIITIR